jgi:FAD/FMN-containing dehydrogenase
MWGTSLDHIIEVGVVTADGEIRRANSSHNEDLLWVRLSKEITSSPSLQTQQPC